MKSMIKDYCRRLRLSGIARHWQDVHYETPEQFLQELLELELKEREANRTSRLLKQAKLPYLKTFENFDWSSVQLPQSIQREWLMDGRFVKEKQNLLLYGPVGTGKTHLAIALAIEACQTGCKAQFFTTGKLVESLLEHKATGTLARFMTKLEKLDLLIIDEFGYVPFNPEGAKLLFQVVADCYERKSIILTTNLEFQQWNTLLGDGHLAAAMIDRLIHHTQILLFNGESYRLKHSMIKHSKF